jgi:hypothetical protein
MYTPRIRCVVHATYIEKTNRTVSVSLRQNKKRGGGSVQRVV